MCPQVWHSEDKKISALATPQVIRIPVAIETVSTQDELLADMMHQVPEQLWSKHDTDVGLIKSAQPIEIKLKPGCRPPRIPHYQLKPEAEAGVEPTINGLLQAGVLNPAKPQGNTAILPILKTDNSKYRLVYDLRVVNEVVEDFDADVPNAPL